MQMDDFQEVISKKELKRRREAEEQRKASDSKEARTEKRKRDCHSGGSRTFVPGANAEQDGRTSPRNNIEDKGNSGGVNNKGRRRLKLLKGIPNDIS